jgi:hypothetical protein
MENRGVAPPYAPYELRAKLSADGASFTCVLARGCKTWMPGTPVSARYELPLPKNLKPVRYELAIGLFDVGADKERVVELGLKASVREPAGYYRVGEVVVASAHP